MSTSTDAWFVRFPDGRVLRATNTDVIRQQFGIGRIPAGSTVRRSPEEEWTSLEWTAEFADLLSSRRETREQLEAPSSPPPRSNNRPPSSPSISTGEGSGVAARLDPTRLQTVGIRGLADELIGALDSTLVRRKIAIALTGAMVLGFVFAFAPSQLFEFSKPGLVFERTLTALAVLTVGTITTALLTRMTFVEVSRLRPARWRESFRGLAGLSLRLAIAQLVVTGNTLLLAELLRQLPRYFLNANSVPESALSSPEVTISVVLAMVVEVCQWPIFGLSLLLAPILAVEGSSIGTALLQWGRLVWYQLGRAFVYEALATGVGLVVSLPLFVPLVAFTTAVYQDPPFVHTIEITRIILTSMALGPLFAYLIVANVFIYLNLRYETVPEQRI